MYYVAKISSYGTFNDLEFILTAEGETSVEPVWRACGRARLAQKRGDLLNDFLYTTYTALEHR